MLLAFMASVPDVRAQQSFIGPEAVLAIEHFNFDCRMDTLIGQMTDDQSYLPLRIRWGKDYQTVNNSCTPDRHGKDSATTFFYPAWDNLRGSVTVRQINGDTLSDILLFIHGKVPGSSPQRDTSMGILVFGQKQLAKVTRIDIGQTTKLKSSPVFSLRLSEGDELVEKGKRDISGRPSYMFVSPTLDINDTSQSAPIVAGVDEPWVRVYPNPAIFSTNVEIRRLLPGDYRVTVVAVNGQTEIEQNVTVGTSGEIFRSIQLDNLASGYYQVQIHSAARLIGSYPVLLIR